MSLGWRTYRVECRNLPGFTLAGLDVQMDKLYVRNAAKRWWRVRAALRQRRMSGYGMQVLVGHLVNLSLVFRPFLSILSSVFRFIVDNAERVAAIDEHVEGEIRTAAALLPFLGCSIEERFGGLAYASDASLRGYAVHCGAVDPRSGSHASFESVGVFGRNASSLMTAGGYPCSRGTMRRPKAQPHFWEVGPSASTSTRHTGILTPRAAGTTPFVISQSWPSLSLARLAPPLARSLMSCSAHWTMRPLQ